MTFRAIVLAVWLAATIQAQDLQTRIIFHPVVDLNKRWFLTAWSISNLRQRSSDNTNLLLGVGSRGQNWWLETMLQRQWSRSGNQLILDARFQKQLGKATIYLEPAVFLNRRAFYEFVIVEHPVWRKISPGLEMENVHQAGRDYLALGFRASRPILSRGNWKLGGALSFRSRFAARDELRLYLNLNRRFEKR